MSDKIHPAAFVWTEVTDATTGEIMRVMLPRQHFRKQCDYQFVLGEQYVLGEVGRENVSAASRGRYFALLHDAWLNLPERYSQDFPTEEHFRKWCLIELSEKEGKEYCNRRTVDGYETPADARRAAITARAADGYTRITYTDTEVTIRTAKSQSSRRKEMDKATIYQSQNDVLELACSLIGISLSELEKKGGRAA